MGTKTPKMLFCTGKPKSAEYSNFAPTMTKVQIGLVQMSCSADPKENTEKAIREIRVAAAKGAQIVICGAGL